MEIPKRIHFIPNKTSIPNTANYTSSETGLVSMLYRCRCAFNLAASTVVVFLIPLSMNRIC